MSDTSDTEPTNVEVFNLVAAAIFARLYENFPIPSTLVPASLAEEVLGEDRYSEPAKPDGVHPREYYEEQKPREATTEGKRYSTIARYSITWLQECGFVNPIQSQSTVNGLGHVLSPKGFEALAAIPTSRKRQGQEISRNAGGGGGGNCPRSGDHRNNF